MHDEAAELRLKAEACRRLADLAAAADPVRKALWLTRADQWKELAAEAAKKSRRRGNRQVAAIGGADAVSADGDVSQGPRTRNGIV